MGKLWDRIFGSKDKKQEKPWSISDDYPAAPAPATDVEVLPAPSPVVEVEEHWTPVPAPTPAAKYSPFEPEPDVTVDAEGRIIAVNGVPVTYSDTEVCPPAPTPAMSSEERWGRPMGARNPAEALTASQREVLDMVTAGAGMTARELGMQFSPEDWKKPGRRLRELIARGLVKEGSLREDRYTGYRVKTYFPASR